MRDSIATNLAVFKERLVGLEFENPILDANARPINEESIQRVWRTLVGKGWKASTDPELNVIRSVSRMFGTGEVNVNSDCAAGNLEMALPPMKTLSDAEVEYRTLLGEIVSTLAEHRMTLLALGIQPAPINDVREALHVNRLHHAFDAMGASTYSNNGMMLISSAHQTGVSVRLSELVATVNELTKVSGLVIALCANSPISDWGVLPWKEWRNVAWKFRFLCNFPGFDRIAGFSERPFGSVADFLRFHWETPPWMILPPTRSGNLVIPDRKLNCADLLRCGEIRGTTLSGEAITTAVELEDINRALLLFWPFTKPHLALDTQKTTVEGFIEAYSKDDLESYLEGRLANCYVEYRVGSASPVSEEMALPALTMGLVNNLAELIDFTHGFEWREWQELADVASVVGMQAQMRGGAIFQMLTELLRIAERGLTERRFGEERYLSVFFERIRAETTPADQAVAVFRKGGKQGLLQLAAYPLT